MRLTTILLAIVTLFCLSAFSQKEVSKDKSKADLFSEKAGSLFQTETSKVGSLKKLDIKTIVITDLVSNDKITAIRLETLHYSSLGSDTKVGTFDKDEIDAVLKSLGIIKAKMEVISTFDYTEIQYRSRGGLEVGCFTSGKKNEWNLYLKLERYDSNSFVFLDKKDIDDLTDLLQQAKTKL